MTRFARAKGSKASNERVPEPITPWNVMKTDLIKSQDEVKNQKDRVKIHEERQKNYDNFVKETESKVVKKWAEFPGTNLKTIKNNKAAKKNNKSLRQLTENDVTDDMIQEMCQSDPEVDGQLVNITKEIEQVLSKENGANNKQKTVDKKRKNKVITTPAENDDAPEETTTKVDSQKIKAKKNKNKKKTLVIPPVAQTDDQQEENVQEIPNKNNKNNKKSGENRQNTKNENQQGEKRKFPKERDNLEHKRRKPQLGESVKVNGEMQKIVYYLGFPVLKSDHDRLVELRKSLVSKGIPKSEVEKTLKLERRKAEKYLTRIKKIVCYQCRESGHLLSECPELGNSNEKSLVDTAATGICFKCSSTEHTYKECKVSKDFNFAKCFICRQQGHISSQCPDNPRGLYPKGGACKLCGDVTHLKKDCPKHVQEQKSNAIFLNTISEGNIESIDDTDTVKPVKKQKKLHKKKVVKF